MHAEAPGFYFEKLFTYDVVIRFKMKRPYKLDSGHVGHVDVSKCVLCHCSSCKVET